MKPSEVVTPFGAIVTTLLSLVCCLPIATVGGLGVGSIGVFLGQASPWLQGLSLGLVGLSLLSLIRARRDCHRRSRTAQIVAIGAAVFVLCVLLFPQLVAQLFAALVQ